MHIALYSPSWPPERSPNGIVTYVSHMRRELEDQGHRVTVIHAGEPNSQSADPRAHSARRGLWRRIKNALAESDPERPVLRFGDLLADTLLSVHRREAIDVVEMEETFGWCAQVQQRVPFPVVTKLHGPAFLTKPEGAMSAALLQKRFAAEGAALRSMKYITSPTRSTIDLTSSHYGLDLHAATVIVNPIADGPPHLHWLSQNARPDEILFVGRFDRHKGGDFLITAFAQLLRRRPSIRLVFVGPNSGLFDNDGGRVGINEFMEQALTADQRKQVAYRGPMPSDQIAPLRCEAAVVVVCSRWENQPNTVLEALLQGCPLVASDAGGMSEIVEHERTGLLFKSEDVTSFCDQVLRLLEDREFATAMGQQGRRRVLHAHSPATVVSKTVEYYQAIK